MRSCKSDQLDLLLLKLVVLTETSVLQNYIFSVTWHSEDSGFCRDSMCSPLHPAQSAVTKIASLRIFWPVRVIVKVRLVISYSDLHVKYRALVYGEKKPYMDSKVTPSVTWKTNLDKYLSVCVAFCLRLSWLCSLQQEARNNRIHANRNKSTQTWQWITKAPALVILTSFIIKAQYCKHKVLPQNGAGPPWFLLILLITTPPLHTVTFQSIYLWKHPRGNMLKSEPLFPASPQHVKIKQNM